MAETVVSEEIEAPVEKLWALLADFGRVDWMHGVSKVLVRGDGVGMVREIWAVGADAPIAEVLESVDEGARRIGYAIPENVPMPVDDYHATCTAIDLGAGRSRLDWAGRFTPRGVDEAAARQHVEAMYGVLIGWVKAALEG